MENSYPVIPYEIAGKYSLILSKINEYKAYIVCKDLSLIDEKCKKLLSKIFSREIEFLKEEKNNFEYKFDIKYSILNLDEKLRKSFDIWAKKGAESLLNHIIETAISLGSTDIHIFKEIETFIVKFRLNGRLRSYTELENSLGEAIIRLIKIRANLDIGKTVRPLEGRFSHQHDLADVDLRLSIMPTALGEKLSLRILGAQKEIYGFSDLGLKPSQIEILKEIIEKKSGFIIITGPTGSGKSTTVFTILKYLNDGSKSIISIEDPVEYTIEGIAQLEISKRQDIIFEDILRFVLRQDPEIINIGEIRDKETATTALESAETGHIVFSTLHTKSAQEAPQRLLQLGADKDILNSNLSLIISQRLVRILCDCKVETVIDEDILDKFSLPKDIKYYRPSGCKNCYFTGYKELKGIFELHIPDEKLFVCPSKGIDEGLRLQIIDLLKDGKTSFEEAKSYIF